MPASRNIAATTLTPRSWPSRPTLARRTRRGRLTPPDPSAPRGRRGGRSRGRAPAARRRTSRPPSRTPAPERNQIKAMRSEAAHPLAHSGPERLTEGARLGRRPPQEPMAQLLVVLGQEKGVEAVPLGLLRLLDD